LVDPLQAGLIALLVSSIPWAFIVYTVYRTPEKIEKWVSMCYRLISWAGLKYEKKGIAGDIQADIKSFSRILNTQVSSDLLPYEIKIDWINEETRESFVKDKKVVVRMRHHKNQAKNFLYATLSYVENGLIPQTRSFIERQVMRAIELVFCNNVFVSNKRFDVRQLFIDEIYEPETRRSSTLKRYINVMDRLENTGHFSRIALREFSDLGHRINESIPKDDVRKDTVEFTKMLERLVQRKQHEDISPTYNGKYIKSSIVLVAKPETYLLHGIDAYLRFINKSIKEGTESFYICALGDQNISIVRQIIDAYEESKDLSIVTRDTYNLQTRQKAICVVLQRKS